MSRSLALTAGFYRNTPGFNNMRHHGIVLRVHVLQYSLFQRGSVIEVKKKVIRNSVEPAMSVLRSRTERCIWTRVKRDYPPQKLLFVCAVTLSHGVFVLCL